MIDSARRTIAAAFYESLQEQLILDGWSERVFPTRIKAGERILCFLDHACARIAEYSMYIFLICTQLPFGYGNTEH